MVGRREFLASVVGTGAVGLLPVVEMNTPVSAAVSSLGIETVVATKSYAASILDYLGKDTQKYLDYIDVLTHIEGGKEWLPHDIESIFSICDLSQMEIEDALINADIDYKSRYSLAVKIASLGNSFVPNFNYNNFTKCLIQIVNRYGGEEETCIWYHCMERNLDWCKERAMKSQSPERFDFAFKIFHTTNDYSLFFDLVNRNSVDMSEEDRSSIIKGLSNISYYIFLRNSPCNLADDFIDRAIRCAKSYQFYSSAWSFYFSMLQRPDLKEKSDEVLAVLLEWPRKEVPQFEQCCALKQISNYVWNHGYLSWPMMQTLGGFISEAIRQSPQWQILNHLTPMALSDPAKCESYFSLGLHQIIDLYRHGDWREDKFNGSQDLYCQNIFYASIWKAEEATYLKQIHSIMESTILRDFATKSLAKKDYRLGLFYLKLLVPEDRYLKLVFKYSDKFKG